MLQIVAAGALAAGGSPAQPVLAPERNRVSAIPDISTAEGIQEQCSTEDAERAGYPSCSQPNLKCKNATADWPKCVPPGDNYKLRFGQGSNFPIGAWWPPPTHEASPELKAYVDANFTMVMVGDRDPEGCQDKDHYKDTWKMVMRQLDVVEDHGLQALIDGYVCSNWGGPQLQGDGAALPFFGEEENGPPGAWVDHAITHKPTPREVEYITQNLRHRKSVVGVLLADDAQDMEGNELNAMAAIKRKTPEIFPWVNQIMDPSHTAWLARAGFPYIMPELYSMTGMGMAAEQAQMLLGDLEVWGRTGERYGQKLWPLLNLPGEGIEVPKVRFQAFAAVAYGAKGIFWFCWRAGGGWDHEAGKKVTDTTLPNRHHNTGQKSAAYDVLAETNSALRAWATPLLAHNTFEGAYHTGWSGPSKTTQEVGPNALVQTMSNDLMAGVLRGKGETTVVVIVDKVMDERDNSKARSVMVKLNPTMVSEVVLINDKGHRSAPMSPIKMVKLKLKPGGAMLLELQPHNASFFRSELQLHLNSFRQWSHKTASPDLNGVRTAYHSKYHRLFDALPGSSMNTLFGAMGSTASAAELADAGFNALIDETTEEPVFRARLNEAMRQGMSVLARAPKLSNESADGGAVVDGILAAHGCHPYFGGVHLNDGQSTAAADAVRMFGSGNLIPLASVTAVADRAQVREAIPFAMLDMSRPWNKLGELVKAWRAVDSYEPYDEEALHVQIDGCSKDRGPDIPASRPKELQFASIASRFAAYTSIAFGAQAIVHSGIGHRGCTPLAVASSIYTGALQQWVERGLLRRPSLIYSSLSPKLEHTSVPGGRKGEVVQSMGDDLLVFVMHDASRTSKLHTRREGVKVINKPAPPMLLIVDARREGQRKGVNVTLQFNTYSWTPMVFDDRAGAGSCDVAGGFGPHLTHGLSLLPGEGVLLLLNMHATESEYNTETKLTAQASTAVTALNRYSRAQVRDRAASIKLRPEFNEIQWKRQHRRAEMLQLLQQS